MATSRGAVDVAMSVSVQAGAAFFVFGKLPLADVRHNFLLSTSSRMLTKLILSDRQIMHFLQMSHGQQ